MKLSRRYVPLSPYAFCRGCDWDRAGLNHVQAEAQVTTHATETGHEVRVVVMSEIIFRVPAEAPSGPQVRGVSPDVLTQVVEANARLLGGPGG